MDSTSPVDGAPGQAQILLLRKTLDAATAGAAALLEVLPPAPAPLPRASTSRVDLLL